VQLRRPRAVGQPDLPSRAIPPGREGEVFGLYTTTGRAAIWLSPALYAAAIALSPATGTAARTSWGILGILVVIVGGLALLLPVKPPEPLTAAPSAASAAEVAVEVQSYRERHNSK
jgi:UMF1 family MFS transporter